MTTGETSLLHSIPLHLYRKKENRELLHFALYPLIAFVICYCESHIFQGKKKIRQIIPTLS